MHEDLFNEALERIEETLDVGTMAVGESALLDEYMLLPDLDEILHELGD